ncbi:Protein fam50-like protein [Temnothorax longispinosus]|uniref:Protein FAM50 homolog n=1 Tax=Temnothorax longispinosus TaxID=300112 RepID=A0A4S2KIT9_9HYME|nr:Protein fam50-like protein [Temnothorax longispinosus]
MSSWSYWTLAILRSPTARFCRNTFYDFIVTKALGKSEPLFTFDVHDDIRVMHDASVETEKSHAGKVLYLSLKKYFV